MNIDVWIQLFIHFLFPICGCDAYAVTAHSSLAYKNQSLSLS